MNFLPFHSNELENYKLHTANEIAGQPELWYKVYNGVCEKRIEIKEFFQKSIPNVNRIILTGAGTSSYIGISLQRAFERELGILTLAIPTTDLITHPDNYFSKDESFLLVSFARSGNSPESLAAVEIADKICKKCYHLIITCDEEGQLAKFQSNSIKYVFLLPKEANDKSLAMTGSYSGMLLSGFLIAGISKIEALEKGVEVICGYGQLILKDYIASIQQIASMNFKRAVFLGSGPLFGTATESHLKLQELTDGEIICKNESFLGFRHGPKAVVNEETLMVYLMSNTEHALKYEKDLVISMKQGKKPLYQIAISEFPIHDIYPDLSITLSPKGKQLDNELLTVSNIIPAQLLGFFKSMKLGLNPDAPSISGAINRVVQGVTIYDIK